MVKQLLKFTGCAAGAAVLVAAGGVCWLAGTESGLQTAASVACRAVPGLTVKAARGALMHPVFTDFAFENEGLTIAAKEVAWALRWRDLLDWRVTVASLRAAGLSVTVKPVATEAAVPEAKAEAASEEAAAEPFALPDWLPAATVESLEVTDAAVAAAGADVKLGRLAMSAALEDGAFTLKSFAAEHLTVKLPASEPSSEPMDWAALEAMLNESGVASYLPGDVTLPLPVAVQSFRGADWHLFSGKDDTAIESIALAADYADGRLRVKEFQAALPAYGEASLSGSVQTTGVWPLDVKTAGRLRMAGESWNWTAAASGELRGRTELKAQVQGAVSAEATVAAELASPRLPMEVTGRLSAPLKMKAGERELTVTAAQASLTGFATAAQLSVTGTAEQKLPKGMDGVPKAEARLTADVTLKDVKNARLVVTPGKNGGALTVTADAGWAPSISAAGRVKAEKLSLADSGVNVKNGEGGLAFSVKQTNGRWAASLTDAALSARVNGRRAAVSGSLFYDGDVVRAQKFRAAAGRNQAVLDGRLSLAEGGAGKLDLSVAAPYLSDLLPTLSGSVNGSLGFSGTLKKPAVTADLTALNVETGGLHIDKVRLKGGLSETADERLTLRAKNVTAGGVAIKRARLRLDGRISSHETTVSVQEATGAFSLQTALSAGADLEKKCWQGKFKTFTAETGPSHWALEAPASVYLSADKVHVTPVRLSGGASKESRLVVKETLVAGDVLQAGVEDFRLVFSDLASLLPHGMKTGGGISGKADVSRRGDKFVWQASLSSDWAAIGRPAQGKKKAAGIEVKNLSVKASGEDANLTAAASMTAAGVPVKADFALSGDALSGRLVTTALPVKGFAVWLPPDVSLEGLLTSDMTVSGTIKAPRLAGRLELSELVASSADLPLNMEPSSVAIVARGSAGDLTADLRTKKGAASVKGDFSWADLANPSAHVTIASDGLRIAAESPVVRLEVASDVRVAYENGAADIRGTVRVPRGFIAVSEVPEGAVSVSSDEVLVDDEATQTGEALKISAMVDVKIEDRVFVNVMGLKSRLKGDLKAMMVKGRTGLNGRVTLEDGTFKAYGQDLEIQKGELIFAGPADNPTLNISAVRNSETTEDNVTSGVRVTGTAASPQVSLFSEPEMSEEAKLSYLLTGHGLEKSGDSDGTALMTSALIGMGASQAGRVVGSVGQALGIRGLAVDTAGSGDSSQVVVSGYILPGLQLKYGMGVFDAVTTLTLKYRLLPQLYLQAVSGESQNLSLLWKFKL